MCLLLDEQEATIAAFRHVSRLAGYFMLYDMHRVEPLQNSPYLETLMNGIDSVNVERVDIKVGFYPASEMQNHSCVILGPATVSRRHGTAADYNTSHLCLEGKSTSQEVTP
jgi:hypothetical protein